MTTIGLATKHKERDNVTALRPHELAIHFASGQVSYAAFHTAKSARHEAKRLASTPGLRSIMYRKRACLITDSWSTIYG